MHKIYQLISYFLIPIILINLYFRIINKKEDKNSDELKSVISEFYQQQLDGELTGEDYHNFYKNMARYIVIEKPTFLSNLYFFITYQVNYMYVRYFMWNFVGRQDDVQGNFDILHGNYMQLPFRLEKKSS